MDDLISRQAALQAMDMWDKFGCGPDGRLVRCDDDSHYVPYVHYDDMVHAIEHLSPAEPEHPSEIQDILNYLDTVLHPIISPEHWDVYSELHDMISSLPTEQSEPLTDKEQRIFLTAMAREEKVCRQVDDECKGITPYEVSLVHVCKEIRRKVKGTLWA